MNKLSTGEGYGGDSLSSEELSDYSRGRTDFELTSEARAEALRRAVLDEPDDQTESATGEEDSAEPTGDQFSAEEQPERDIGGNAEFSPQQEEAIAETTRRTEKVKKKSSLDEVLASLREKEGDPEVAVLIEIIESIQNARISEETRLVERYGTGISGWVKRKFGESSFLRVAQGASKVGLGAVIGWASTRQIFFGHVGMATAPATAMTGLITASNGLAEVISGVSQGFSTNRRISANERLMNREIREVVRKIEDEQQLENIAEAIEAVREREIEILKLKQKKVDQHIGAKFLGKAGAFVKKLLPVGVASAIGLPTGFQDFGGIDLNFAGIKDALTATHEGGHFTYLSPIKGWLFRYADTVLGQPGVSEADYVAKLAAEHGQTLAQIPVNPALGGGTAHALGATGLTVSSKLALASGLALAGVVLAISIHADLKKRENLGKISASYQSEIERLQRGDEELMEEEDQETEKTDLGESLGERPTERPESIRSTVEEERPAIEVVDEQEEQEPQETEATEARGSLGERPTERSAPRPVTVETGETGEDSEDIKNVTDYIQRVRAELDCGTAFANLDPALISKGRKIVQDALLARAGTAYGADGKQAWDRLKSLYTPAGDRNLRSPDALVGRGIHFYHEGLQANGEPVVIVDIDYRLPDNSLTIYNKPIPDEVKGDPLKLAKVTADRINSIRLLERFGRKKATRILVFGSDGQCYYPVVEGGRIVDLIPYETTNGRVDAMEALKKARGESKEKSSDTEKDKTDQGEDERSERSTIGGVVPPSDAHAGGGEDDESPEEPPEEPKKLEELLDDGDRGALQEIEEAESNGNLFRTPVKYRDSVARLAEKIDSAGGFEDGDHSLNGYKKITLRVENGKLSYLQLDYRLDDAEIIIFLRSISGFYPMHVSNFKKEEDGISGKASLVKVGFGEKLPNLEEVRPYLSEITEEDVVVTTIIARADENDNNYYQIETIDGESGEVNLRQYEDDLIEMTGRVTVLPFDLFDEYRIVGQPDPEKEGQSVAILGLALLKQLESESASGTIGEETVADCRDYLRRFYEDNWGDILFGNGSLGSSSDVFYSKLMAQPSPEVRNVSARRLECFESEPDESSGKKRMITMVDSERLIAFDTDDEFRPYRCSSDPETLRTKVIPLTPDQLSKTEPETPVTEPPKNPGEPETDGGAAEEEPVVPPEKVDSEVKTEIDFNRAVDLDSKIGIGSTLADRDDREYTVEGVRADGTMFLKANSGGEKKLAQYDPETVYRDFTLTSSELEGEAQFPFARRIISRNKVYEKDSSLVIPEPAVAENASYLQAYYQENKEAIDQETETNDGNQYMSDVTETDFIRFERVSETQVICGFVSKDNRYPRIVFDVNSGFSPQIDVFNLPNNNSALTTKGDDPGLEDGDGDESEAQYEEPLPAEMDLLQRQRKLIAILESEKGKPVEVVTKNPELRLVVTQAVLIGGRFYIRKEDGNIEVRFLDQVSRSMMDAISFRRLTK